jgi:HSP20 family protein
VSVTLPDEADRTKVNAESKEDGRKVHLPRSEKAKPKSLEVKIA